MPDIMGLYWYGCSNVIRGSESFPAPESLTGKNHRGISGTTFGVSKMDVNLPPKSFRCFFLGV